ncbi:MAG: sigma-E processing peptidase SpoIIGA [Firmicutes bacterium]|nr:sigma-E processing peptidase SpoIIGA [Bacillota bacterium]
MREVFIDDWLLGSAVSIVMNALLLSATGRVLKLKISGRRILLAALLGGLYYFLLCYRLELGLRHKLELLIFAGMGIVMLLVAFTVKSFKAFLRLVSLFSFLLILTSGITYFVFNPPFTERRAVYSAWEVILVNLIALLVITELGWGLVHRLLFEKECLYTLRLTVNGVSKELSALLDTGNLLVDPMTKHPVIVVATDSMKEVLPPEVLALSRLLARGEFPDNTAIEFSPEWASRLRFINYTSIGKQRGFLLGFRPDEVVLMTKNPKKLSPVVIGLYHLTSGSGEDYQALLPSSVLAGVY